MIGHAKAGNDKIKHIKAGNSVIKGAYAWENNKWVNLWRGASAVTYYDGTRLLGTADVDEGSDILHPSFSVAKSGYTHVGWTIEYNGKTETMYSGTKGATGEPMVARALYLPNTLAVVTGGHFDTNSNSYKYSTWDTDSLSGNISVGASMWYHENEPYSNSGSFTLNSSRYNNISIVIGVAFGHGYDQVAYYDGSRITSDTPLTYNIGSAKTHTFSVAGKGGPWYGLSYIFIKSCTYSSPIAFI